MPAPLETTFQINSPSSVMAINNDHNESQPTYDPDLDSCKEIWHPELSKYIIDTQKRKKQIEEWFEDGVSERNSRTASAVSHHYADRVAVLTPRALLLSPPSPTLPSSSLGHANGNGRGHDQLPYHDGVSPPPGEFVNGSANVNGAEAGMHVLDLNAEPTTGTAGGASGRDPEQASAGGAAPSTAAPRPKKRARKSKATAASSIATPATLSDEGSEEEVPLISASTRKPAKKRRKVDQTAGASTPTTMPTEIKTEPSLLDVNGKPIEEIIPDITVPGAELAGHSNSTTTNAKSKGKGKGKSKNLLAAAAAVAAANREPSLDSVGAPSGSTGGTPKAGRTGKRGQRKILPSDPSAAGASGSASVTGGTGGGADGSASAVGGGGGGGGNGGGSDAGGDTTKPPSRPPTPTLANGSMVVFELGEHVPPMKRARNVDDLTMMKRIRTLEEQQRKVWTAIARRDIPRVCIIYVSMHALCFVLFGVILKTTTKWYCKQVYKVQQAGSNTRDIIRRRLATACSMAARKPLVAKAGKAAKETQVRSKRLMREMLVFWKKNEREERDVRKREQKQALDRARLEEEKREEARQARKLEFLISQTELYSHFVGNKLKSESFAVVSSLGSFLLTLSSVASEIEGDGPSTNVPAGAELADVDPNTLQDIDFDNGKFIEYSISCPFSPRISQRTQPISICMPRKMHKPPLPWRSSVRSSSTTRLLWNARRTRRWRWQKVRRISSAMARIRRMRRVVLRLWIVSYPANFMFH
jgi:chromatin-remodeling ATPase INO80